MNDKKIQELIDNGLDIDIINAGISLGIDLDNIEEAYSGEFRNDEEFAQDMAEILPVEEGRAALHTCFSYSRFRIVVGYR